MSLVAFPLGYTHSNFLYSMVRSRSKIINTATQIISSTTRTITNSSTTTNSTATDSPETNTEALVDALPEENPHTNYVALGILVFLAIFLIAKLIYYMKPRSRYP